MHCNLRPPDVAPVILGFNYEVHNTSTCYISAKSDSPWLQYQSSRTRAPADMGKGKGGHLQSRKCCKVLFVMQMLSKASLNEVFMHHFEKMPSASGGFAVLVLPIGPPGPPPIDSLPPKVLKLNF